MHSSSILALTPALGGFFPTATFDVPHHQIQVLRSRVKKSDVSHGSCFLSAVVQFQESTILED